MHLEATDASGAVRVAGGEEAVTPAGRSSRERPAEPLPAGGTSTGRTEDQVVLVERCVELARASSVGPDRPWARELWPLALVALLDVLAALPALRSRGLGACSVDRPVAGGLLDPLGVFRTVALAGASGLAVL